MGGLFFFQTKLLGLRAPQCITAVLEAAMRFLLAHTPKNMHGSSFYNNYSVIYVFFSLKAQICPPSSWTTAVPQKYMTTACKVGEQRSEPEHRTMALDTQTLIRLNQKLQLLPNPRSTQHPPVWLPRSLTSSSCTRSRGAPQWASQGLVSPKGEASSALPPASRAAQAFPIEHSYSTCKIQHISAWIGKIIALIKYQRSHYFAMQRKFKISRT